MMTTNKYYVVQIDQNMLQNKVSLGTVRINYQHPFERSLISKKSLKSW